MWVVNVHKIFKVFKFQYWFSYIRTELLLAMLQQSFNDTFRLNIFSLQHLQASAKAALTDKNSNSLLSVFNQLPGK